MIVRYPTASLLLFLTGLRSTESLSILTCVSPPSASPQLTCSNVADSIIWVKKAYLAITLSATPTYFCDTPTLDPARNDCESSVDDVTNDANIKCAMYQNCRLNVDYALLNCPTSYVGFTYLYAEFECLPTKISGVNLPSFILSDARTAFAQPGLSYFRSVNYASYSSQRGACRLQVPANTRATWQLLDLRGRLINLATGCAYLLQIYTRSVYRQWCAELTWKPEQFEIMTSNEAEVFNLNFNPIYGQNSEGKVWMSLNLTDAGGNQVNKINITCGRDIILDTPPTTAFSSTSISTTDAPSSTSTSSTTATSSTTTTSPTSTTSTTTTPTSTTTTSTATNPSTTDSTSNPLTTSSISSSSLTQASSSVAAVQLSTPGVTVSFSTSLDASSTTTSIETENETTGEYNGTYPLTTLASSSNKPDYTVWLIIGLTVGGGLLILVFIVVAIAVCGYRKKRANAQRQSDVIFAWERAETGVATSGESGDKTSPSSAKPKVNTYCKGPPGSPGVYHEIFPTNTESNATGNSAIEMSKRKDAPPHRPNKLNYTGQPRVNARQPASNMNEDVQINPVYGHLDLTNYILPIDGVEETVAI